MFNPPKETPAIPTTEQQKEIQTDLANGMLAMREMLRPLFDAADGMRADLEARGWSPTAAEKLTMTWLQRNLINCTPVAGTIL